MKYAILRMFADGKVGRACPHCGREEPPWLAPSPGKNPVAVRCPCGYQYRYTSDPSERMRFILDDLNRQAAAQWKEAAREQREKARQLPGIGIHPDPPKSTQTSQISQIFHGNSQTSQISQPATPATKTHPAATEKHPPRTPPQPKSTPAATPPPEAPAPPEPVKTNWKASPKLAAQMLKAMEPPEKRPPRMTLERRRIAHTRNLAAESRFQDQQINRAGRHLQKLLDQIDPEPDWATMPITPVWTVRLPCPLHLKAASSPPSKNA